MIQDFLKPLICERYKDGACQVYSQKRIDNTINHPIAIITGMTCDEENWKVGKKLFCGFSKITVKCLEGIRREDNEN